MSLSFNDVYIYATAKVSTVHIPDKDFLYGITSNKDVDYVYRGANNSVIVNLGAIGSSWDNIQGTLRGNGWDSGCLPGLLRVFQALVEQNIFCVEFHDNHPKVRWADWFTPDTFMHIKPIAYGINLYSYNELPEAQQDQARKLQKLITPETLQKKIFCVVGNGLVINTEDAKDFVLTEPEEINKDYDGLIETVTGKKLVVKVNKATNTADVGIILN
ncbi:hypothetical protein KKJ04_20145 [Xenorhabdus bovienii]|uniref:hypothetical protein n=1 Tax=Xenorhabdus bovienii TaxID=40576 RepID=UPI0023B29359|nr:hypothetical protein [Xenorhabdus bovienii]MDE9447794.1 hypothetical protein [Xenorhabdus bovienii]